MWCLKSLCPSKNCIAHISKFNYGYDLKCGFSQIWNKLLSHQP